MLGNGNMRTNKGTFQSFNISEFNGKMRTLQNPPNYKQNKQKIIRSSAIAQTTYTKYWGTQIKG